MTANQPLCAFLDWDSEFFGCRIAQISCHRLSDDEVAAVSDWCANQQIDCLYFLADADDLATIRRVEANHFHLVDIRVTLSKRFELLAHKKHVGFPEIIRFHCEGDLANLKAIAKNAHHDSRFYADSHFPVQQCEALYETWIEKSCRGYADAVLVAENHGRAIGYISCHVTEAQAGKIGLVGVDEAMRGQGIGQRLLAASLEWFQAQGCSQVTVVTQGRNIQAQRLYQKHGFLTQSLQLWYHRWWNE